MNGSIGTTAAGPAATQVVVPPSRSHRARKGLMALYLTAFFSASFVISALTGTVALFRLNLIAFSPDPTHRAELHRALHGPALLTVLGALVLNLLVFALLAGRAGYPGARILQLLIPGWNYVVMHRIMWRWTDIQHWRCAAAPVIPRQTTYAQFGVPQYVVPNYGTPREEAAVYRVPAGYEPVDVTPRGGAVDITPGGGIRVPGARR